MLTSVAGGMSNVVRNKVRRDISIHSVSNAVRADDEVACRGFVKMGVDLNQQYTSFNWSVLLEAAEYNKFKIIPILLDGHADIEIRNIAGRTPLMLAVLKDNVEAVEILLRRGASPTKIDKQGRTALSYAKSQRTKDLICERFRQMKKRPF